ncbi:MAG: 5-oxoprolinase subunit PxpA [Lachnospiraceae bacterium]|nr:5-oxoprolinase subunit PxpA [Lachnospiraceae bacterium]
MYSVDLNCDLGESFGNYICGLDEEVIPFISSANVACGFHASDPVVMAKTVELAKANKVCVGAHPGYPDLVGFGRRNLNASPAEVKAMVQYQIGALKAFCTAQGIPLCHVKPHGAMYNMAGKDAKLAEAICEGIQEVDPELILLGLSGSEMLKAAGRMGLKAAKEVFADRAYEEDGSLVARTKPGAMITDENEAIQRVICMVKEGKVTAVTGKEIQVEAHSICVHGDGPKALAFVQKIREALIQEGIQIASLREIIKRNA